MDIKGRISLTQIKTYTVAAGQLDSANVWLLLSVVQFTTACQHVILAASSETPKTAETESARALLADTLRGPSSIVS